MNNYRWLLWVIRIALLIGSGYCFENYFLYKNSVDTNENIPYTFLSKRIIGGSKFNHYELDILYKGTQYKADVTAEQYKDQSAGKLPDLYYLSSKNKVFAFWEIENNHRLTILFFLGFCCTFVPISKIERKLKDK